MIINYSIFHSHLLVFTLVPLHSTCDHQFTGVHWSSLGFYSRSLVLPCVLLVLDRVHVVLLQHRSQLCQSREILDLTHCLQNLLLNTPKLDKFRNSYTGVPNRIKRKTEYTNLYSSILAFPRSHQSIQNPFKHLSRVYFKNSQRHLAVNYFRETLPLRCITGLWIRLCMVHSSATISKFYRM